MAEEVSTVVAPAASPVTTEAAPVVATVAATPAVETPAVVPVTPAVETHAPALEVKAEASVAEVKAETPVEAKPLLNPEEPKEEAKTDAPKVEAEATKVEPAPLPVYEFKLPDGAKTDNPLFKSFNTKLGEFQNLSKAEQAAVQKFGQEMLEMHMEDVKAITESQNRSAWDWFNNRNKEWLETSKKDPAIGGENFDKTIYDASRAISLYGGTKAQQIEIAKLLQETGVENHHAILRFMANVTRIAAKEGSPVSSQGAPAQKPGIAQMMYGATSKGAA